MTKISLFPKLIHAFIKISEFQCPLTFSCSNSLCTCVVQSYLSFIKHHPRKLTPKVSVVVGDLLNVAIVIGHHYHVSLQLKFQLDSPERVDVVTASGGVTVIEME